MTDTKPPFRRDAFLDKPGIVGARWWQDSVRQPVGRRQAVLVGLLGGAAILGSVTVFGIGLKGCAEGEKTETVARPALDLQKKYGWSFGANDEPLAFVPGSSVGLDRARLRSLAQLLAPKTAAYLPYYASTLFDALAAAPTELPRDDDTTPKPLVDALVAVRSTSMTASFRRGLAVARLADVKHVAVVVDLPGPDAVAFAAGASSRFEPVFGFENWPHPRGVVPAHVTLAAAATLLARFEASAREATGTRPPMFVLDRDRLAPYADDATRFDNRWAAKLPPADALRALGLTHVLYVVPLRADRELDDVNDDLVHYEAKELRPRVLAGMALVEIPTGTGSRTLHPLDAAWDEGLVIATYEGEREDGPRFARDYPGCSSASPAAGPPTSSTASYVPGPRATPYSTGSTVYTPSATRPRPPAFGAVPIVVAATTGVVLGARLQRSGSWNRSSGGTGG